MSAPAGPPRPALAEFTGTGLLVAVVVGSGIMAVRLSPGAAGVELLENSLATTAGLAVIIAVLAPVSGAHLNPLVSAADWALGRRSGAGCRGGTSRCTRRRSWRARSAGRFWRT